MSTFWADKYWVLAQQNLNTISTLLGAEFMIYSLLLMKTDMKWLVACGGLLAGEAFAFAIPGLSPLWPVAAIAGWFAVLAALSAGSRAWPAIAAFSLGAVLAMQNVASREELCREISVRSLVEPYTALFRVEGVPVVRTDDAGMVWHSFPSHLGNLKVRVVAPFAEGSPAPRLGERWEMSGYLSFGAKGRRGRTFWVKGALSSAKRVSSPVSDRFWCTIRRARATISRRIAIGMEYDPLAVSLLRCIFLGDRDIAPKKDMAAFSAAGTIHVFAVSGIHVVLIATILRILASVCLVPGRFSGLAVVPLLWFYAAMIGFSPSATRATAMVTLSYVGIALGRRPCGITAWAATFLAVHILDPSAIGNIGGVLSFAVMLALMLWSEWMPESLVRGRFGFLGFTFIAWAAGVPIIVHAFGRVSIIALAANLAVVPLLSVALTMSAAGMLAGFFSVFLAARLNGIAALAIELMANISTTAAAIPGATIALADWGLAECILWYAALLLACLLARHVSARRRRAFWD